MPSTPKDQLFTLVKSLNKAEKRNFRLYVNRLQSGSEAKFAQLFDVLDKLSIYNESLILKKLKSVRKKHLANLKRHLYKQILVSLRLIYIHKNIDIEIREQLDFARILYGKGLYMQSLKLLERIKKIALDNHQDILHMEILEFQKLIETRHITRSRQIKNKMEALLGESARRSYVCYSNSHLSNLNIKIHGYYIQHGHAKSEEEKLLVQKFFRKIRSTNLTEAIRPTFFEKANLFQSHMWYYYILLDFRAASDYSLQLINLFEVDPQIQDKDPDLYLRALYYYLTFLFLLGEKNELYYYLKKLRNFIGDRKEQLNANSQMIAWTYFHLSQLNYYYINGRFEEAIRLVKQLKPELEELTTEMDIHRLLLFYYKFGFAYFACGRYPEALDYLNEIIQLKNERLRDDLLNNTQLLNLICHYELGNKELLSYLLTSTQRTFSKSTDVGELQRLTLLYLRKLNRTPAGETLPVFQELKDQIGHLSGIPFERKSFAYLDINAWIDSHLQNCLIKDLFDQEVALNKI